MNWIARFPWAKGVIGGGLGGVGLLTIIAAFRLGFGLEFPKGYEPLLYSLVAMCGVGVGGGVGKRATDYTLAAIKTGDAATIAAVVGPPKVPDSDTPANALTKADAQLAADALKGEAG